MRPAWSWQFEPEHLQSVEALPTSGPISRDWAWGGSTGAGVKVAIVDSGVESSHPAVGGVEGAVAIEWDPEARDVRMIEGPHDDLFGHGTACAGIIRSLAPDVEVHSVRVLGERLTGKALVFAAGLRWAIDNRMNICNLSLSTRKRDYFDVFHELADDAYFHHMMLVSAINNVESPSYPSQYSAVFSVAAHDGKDPFEFQYNPSPPVEFGAPGIDVTVPWSNGSYIEATGNSFAAPHIAGVIALILGKHPRLTPFQMKTILHATAGNAAESTG